jgi:hypothetical protein
LGRRVRFDRLRSRLHALDGSDGSPPGAFPMLSIA